MTAHYLPPPHFVVDLLDGIQQAADGTLHVAVQITRSSAIRAFRVVENAKTGFQLPKPVTNAGTLRGVVRSKRARVIFNLSSNIAEKFEKYDTALGMAGIILDLGKDLHRFTAIYSSALPRSEKARLSTLIAGTTILRSVTGVVPSGAHLVAKALEGYCEILTLARLQPARKWEGQLRALDVNTSAAHSEIFTPEFMQVLGDETFNLFDAHIHFN